MHVGRQMNKQNMSAWSVKRASPMDCFDSFERAAGAFGRCGVDVPRRYQEVPRLR